MNRDEPKVKSAVTCFVHSSIIPRGKFVLVQVLEAHDQEED